MSHNLKTRDAIHHEWMGSIFIQKRTSKGDATLSLGITQVKLILEMNGRTCIKM
jgi:hypothetical protein